MFVSRTVFVPYRLNAPVRSKPLDPKLVSGEQSVSEVLLGIAVAVRGLGMTIVSVTTSAYVGLPHAAIASATNVIRFFDRSVARSARRCFP